LKRKKSMYIRWLYALATMLIFISGVQGDEGFGQLDFSQLSTEQEKWFWSRLLFVAFEDAILDYCHKPTDFEAKAKAAIRSCVTEDALHKADSFFRIQKNKYVEQVTREELNCDFESVVAGALFGVGFQSNDKQEGVVVSNVVRDSAAGRAGIEPGDVILKINGKQVRNPEEILAGIANNDLKFGVSVEAVRGNTSYTIDVELLTPALNELRTGEFRFPKTIGEATDDLEYVLSDVGSLCQQCKTSIWAPFCR
jgi:hypothetical protein